MDRFMNLMNMFDHQDILPHFTRMEMYKELIDIITIDFGASESDAGVASVPGFEGVLDDILKALRLYYDELVGEDIFEDKFKDLFSKWIHIPSRKTIYHNPHNVHSFMTPAAKAAKEIMVKYPSTYTSRPFDHPFFNMIETEELVNGIHIPSLFASIWFYITTHKEREALARRLLEEMVECKDMCLSGHMVRLVNSVKGFDDEFEFNMEEYEYHKAYIFNQLNKLLLNQILDLENLLPKMEVVVNNHLNMEEIIPDHMVAILKDYSKSDWIYNGRFTFLTG